MSRFKLILIIFLECIREADFDYLGSNIEKRKVSSEDECAKLSFSSDIAAYWTFAKDSVKENCYLKSSKVRRTRKDGVVSGNWICGGKYF